MADYGYAATSGPQVQFAQSYLKALNLYGGATDGVWSQDLALAVLKFQEQQGLGKSGVLDSATMAQFVRINSYVNGGAGTQAIDAKAVELYGQGVAALLYGTDPEVAKVIRDAATQELDPGRLQGLLSQTEYWKRQTDSQRQWDQHSNDDPGQANEQRKDRTDDIVRAMIGLGIRPDYETARKMAEDSLRNGWDSAQINRTLAALIPSTAEGGVLNQGQIGASAATVRQLAHSYHVTLTDDQILGYVKRITDGSLTTDGLEVLFRQQAKAKYPSLAGIIDAGGTPEDYFGNTKSMVARELDMDPNTIDLMDPKWSSLTQMVDANGHMRPMTYSEARAFARQQPEWWQTDAANEQANDLALFIGERFGMVTG